MSSRIYTADVELATMIEEELMESFSDLPINDWYWTSSLQEEVQKAVSNLLAKFAISLIVIKNGEK